MLDTLHARGQRLLTLYSIYYYTAKEQKMSNKYYVYKLIDPRTNEPFYVGKGCGNRCNDHLSGKTFGENTYKDNVIAKIRSINLEPYVEFVRKNLAEDAAYSLEDELIVLHGRKRYDEGGILTNLCLGKQPPSRKGKKASTETRAKMSASKKGVPVKSPTKETRSKISATLKGRPNLALKGRKCPSPSAETKAKLSAALKGKKRGSAPLKKAWETRRKNAEAKLAALGTSA